MQPGCLEVAAMRGGQRGAIVVGEAAIVAGRTEDDGRGDRCRDRDRGRRRRRQQTPPTPEPPGGHRRRLQARELRKLGRHIHRRTAKGTADGAGWEALSERELQVARLVVDRRTNREIAAELFVSLKTVEAHMRNLFRRLDVSSRVEVERAERAARAP